MYKMVMAEPQPAAAPSPNIGNGDEDGTWIVLCQVTDKHKKWLGITKDGMCHRHPNIRLLKDDDNNTNGSKKSRASFCRVCASEDANGAMWRHRHLYAQCVEQVAQLFQDDDQDEEAWKVQLDATWGQDVVLETTGTNEKIKADDNFIGTSPPSLPQVTTEREIQQLRQDKNDLLTALFEREEELASLRKQLEAAQQQAAVAPTHDNKAENKSVVHQHSISLLKPPKLPARAESLGTSASNNKEPPASSRPRPADTNGTGRNLPPRVPSRAPSREGNQRRLLPIPRKTSCEQYVTQNLIKNSTHSPSAQQQEDSAAPPIREFAPQLLPMLSEVTWQGGTVMEEEEEVNEEEVEQQVGPVRAIIPSQMRASRAISEITWDEDDLDLSPRPPPPPPPPPPVTKPSDPQEVVFTPTKKESSVVSPRILSHVAHKDLSTTIFDRPPQRPQHRPSIPEEILEDSSALEDVIVAALDRPPQRPRHRPSIPEGTAENNNNNNRSSNHDERPKQLRQPSVSAQSFGSDLPPERLNGPVPSTDVLFMPSRSEARLISDSIFLHSKNSNNSSPTKQAQVEYQLQAPGGLGKMYEPENLAGLARPCQHDSMPKPGGTQPDPEECGIGNDDSLAWGRLSF